HAQWRYEHEQDVANTKRRFPAHAIAPVEVSVDQTPGQGDSMLPGKCIRFPLMRVIAVVGLMQRGIVRSIYQVNGFAVTTFREMPGVWKQQRVVATSPDR